MQLSNLIKQVNGLIDHREQKEQQIVQGNHEKDRIKSVKKQAMFKGKSKTVPPEGLLIGPGRVNEDNEDEEVSQNASARQRQENNELLAINAGYQRDEQEPSNIANMLAHGTKNKPVG